MQVICLAIGLPRVEVIVQGEQIDAKKGTIDKKIDIKRKVGAMPVHKRSPGIQRSEQKLRE